MNEHSEGNIKGKSEIELELEKIETYCNLFVYKISSASDLGCADEGQEHLKMESYKIFILDKLLNVYSAHKLGRIYLEVTNIGGVGEKISISNIYSKYPDVNSWVSPGLTKLTQNCIDVFNTLKNSDKSTSLNLSSILYYYRTTDDKSKGNNFERTSSFNLLKFEIRAFIDVLIKELASPYKLEDIKIELEKDLLSKGLLDAVAPKGSINKPSLSAVPYKGILKI